MNDATSKRTDNRFPHRNASLLTAAAPILEVLARIRSDESTKRRLTPRQLLKALTATTPVNAVGSHPKTNPSGNDFDPDMLELYVELSKRFNYFTTLVYPHGKHEQDPEFCDAQYLLCALIDDAIKRDSKWDYHKWLNHYGLSLNIGDNPDYPVVLGELLPHLIQTLEKHRGAPAIPLPSKDYLLLAHSALGLAFDPPSSNPEASPPIVHWASSIRAYIRDLQLVARPKLAAVEADASPWRTALRWMPWYIPPMIALVVLALAFTIMAGTLWSKSLATGTQLTSAFCKDSEASCGATKSRGLASFIEDYLLALEQGAPDEQTALASPEAVHRRFRDKLGGRAYSMNEPADEFEGFVVQLFGLFSDTKEYHLFRDESEAVALLSDIGAFVKGHRNCTIFVTGHTTVGERVAGTNRRVAEARAKQVYEALEKYVPASQFRGEDPYQGRSEDPQVTRDPTGNRFPVGELNRRADIHFRCGQA